jgi:hypothetical protein
MNRLLSPSAKDREDSKKDLHVRISDRIARRSWAFLNRRKRFWLLPFVLTLITALLLMLSERRLEPVVEPSDDVFVLGR